MSRMETTDLSFVADRVQPQTWTLFHVHARGEEINATFHADQHARNRIVEDQSLDRRLRDQVNKRTWAAFTLRNLKDLAPFMDLVKAKYEHINQESTGKQPELRPIAF